MAGFFKRLFGRTAEARPEVLSPADYFAGSEAWTAVASSNVHSIAYYGQGYDGELRVRFKDEESGKVNAEYAYYRVPYSVYAAMLDAGSKGSFVWTDLRRRYGYTAIWRAPNKSGKRHKRLY